jgi:hypothetical protein
VRIPLPLIELIVGSRNDDEGEIKKCHAKFATLLLKPVRRAVV